MTTSTTAFIYPATVYVGNQVPRQTIIQTSFALPNIGNDGDAVILVNSINPNGLYVWLNATWVRALTIEIVSEASIFRNSLDVYVKIPIEVTVPGTVYVNSTLSTNNFVLADRNNVYVNLQDQTDQTARVVLDIANIVNNGSVKQLAFKDLNSVGIGIDSINLPEMSLGNLLDLVVSTKGIFVNGSISARDGFNTLVPVKAALPIAFIAVISVSDPNALISSDGGVTYSTFTSGFIKANSLDNYLRVAIGSSILMEAVFSVTTSNSSNIVVLPNTDNLGCTITDLGSSRLTLIEFLDYPGELTYKEFSINVTASAAKASVLFSLSSLSNSFVLHLLPY